ncbi:carbohydrate-binding module family 12 protein [Ramaria rubella]|nr:carbohydrate-binding module family 12 protein [Ramaria rubella]
MVNEWEPGTQYELGAVVFYKIIQPHRSESNWTPPATPALWGKLPEHDSESRPAEYQQPQQQAPPQYKGGSLDGEEKPWHEQHSQKVEVHHEEQQKHWYDLDDKRKKELEIGGGLAAGLALLGAGYVAYHKHGKNEEQKKAQVWALQKWLRDAQARAEAFHRNGPQGPVTWILTNGKNIPRGAILGGQDANGQPVFIARAFHEGGVQVGKAGPQFELGGVVGYNHKEFQVGAYEVLIGDGRAVRWVDTHGHLKPAGLGCRLVEGGHEEDGTFLFIARADHKHGVYPGKASEVLDGAYIPYDGNEECKNSYRVLAYA